MLNGVYRHNAIPLPTPKVANMPTTLMPLWFATFAEAIEGSIPLLTQSDPHCWSIAPLLQPTSKTRRPIECAKAVTSHSRANLFSLLSIEGSLLELGAPEALSVDLV